MCVNSLEPTDTFHRKRIFTRSIIPAACQKDITGRQKMAGISQFHSSLTGQASANEKSVHRTRFRSMTPRIRILLRFEG